MLGGKLERIQDLKDRGVAMLTLTWNGENELGRGVLSPGDTGLTPFGRRAVKALERAGIVVDVSHASPELFWDVAELAERPMVASHSNAKAVCGHPRNLTKEQFLAIRDRGGLVGLNFYQSFLNDRPQEASREDVLRHARVFPGPGRRGHPGHGQRLRRGEAPGGPAGGGGHPRACARCFWTGATPRPWWKSSFTATPPGFSGGGAWGKNPFDRTGKVRYSTL